MSKGSVWTGANPLRLTSLLLALAAWLLPAAAEDTYIYTVQITASVNESPASITLNWEPDPYGANSYEIYRKGQDGTSWGSPIATVSGSSTSYTDSNVALGGAYEYQIVKNASQGYRGYGYIFVGVLRPLADSRGKLVLLVATNSTPGLEPELARLENDLVGDGWQVLRRNVSSNNTPEQARAAVRTEYLKDPAGVRAVFLLGHVPVLHSGNLNYDTHLTRPMPADAYYGEMDDVWSTDPWASPSFMPSEIELMVGRVDFFDMPGTGLAAPWPNERDLIKRYLDKDHAWRHGAMTLPRRALMGNRRGDESGMASAASGYRNFQPIVGAGNVMEARVADNAQDWERWISVLGREEYLLAFGCGGGLPQGISWLGTHGPYKEAWSSDVVALDAKAAFVMLFGSWFGEWDKPDNFMRSFLVTSRGLAVCLAGWPHWYMHHVALGEPIGYSARLTMNNGVTYTNQINGMARAVYISLLGDPTLRIDVVQPVSNLSAVRNNGAVHLNWTGSPDANRGSHVYRSGAKLGPFTRITQDPVQGTTYTDWTPPAGESFYMVRAIKLEQRFSGSYFNASQGITAGVPAAPPPPPTPIITARSSPGQVVLTWNTAPGATYHVEGKHSLNSPWTVLSQTLQAQGNTLSWTNPLDGEVAGFLRVRAP